MRVRTLNALADACARLAALLDRWAATLRRCPDCGRNPYQGEPCK